ncbi:helix-turn-helix transcriptional regulator [Amycolatopsis coloradensis]|uniref:Helix-turn-helix transcriptional regulator n=1 Tax=Amycolatopsis coloradensis TaxID=76021 RepID=A0ACD5BJK5_9PSEU
MAASTPPRDLLFETTDSDQAGEFITGVYGADIRLTGSKKGYRYRHTRMATDAFTIDSGSQTHNLTVNVEPLPMLLIAFPRAMTMDYWSRSVEHRFGPGEVLLASRDEQGPPYRVRWCDGTVLVATLPFATLDQVAATETTRRDTPVRFTDLRPATRTAAQHLTATIDYLATGLRDQPHAMREPLVASTAGRLLATTALTTFPNTALTEPTIEDRHDSHPATLQRAIAYIDDHAHEDISVADIATTAHVTIRALQYAFRRHRGTTPMGYLRQARLQQAHQELLAADPGTGVTVTEIGARWGFFHPGRFAHHYRTTYGCPPYRTLRRDGR